MLDGLCLVSDEYAAINSVCYGDPFEECQHGGVVNVSELRIPADVGFHDRCSSISGSVPSRVTTLDDTPARRARAAAAGIPQQLCKDTESCLRARQLQSEAYCKVPSSQDPVYGTVASSTVQAVSADLPPAQLVELQALVEKYKDQIS